MNKRSTRSPEEHNNWGLFIALVIVAFVITFSMPLGSGTPFRIALLVGCGALYTAIGLLVSPRVQGSGMSLASLIQVPSVGRVTSIRTR